MAIPIIGDVINAVKDVLSEVIVDKDKRDQVNLEIDRIKDKAEARLHDETMAQIDVNKVEASSGSLFVAGWRPFAGWVGGFGLAYSVILQPFGSWLARINGYLGDFPVIDNQLLLYVLGGMLGLGDQRTHEKVKGIATNDMTNGAQNKADTTHVTMNKEGEVDIKREGTQQSAPSHKKVQPHFKI